MTSTKHYHVTQGLEGGYLPDVCYTSKFKYQAADIAQSLADEFRNDWLSDDTGKMINLWIISGNKNEGYFIGHKEWTYYGKLGYIINIDICYESDCIDELED